MGLSDHTDQGSDGRYLLAASVLYLLLARWSGLGSARNFASDLAADHRRGLLHGVAAVSMACLRQGNDGEEVLNGLVCKTRDMHNQQHGVLNWLVFEAPKDETSERVRQALEGLLFVVTGALVSNRTEAEQDDQSPH